LLDKAGTHLAAAFRYLHEALSVELGSIESEMAVMDR